MSAAQDCFTNVIGLSRTVCPCAQDNQPSDYDLSESTLFLDEEDGLDLNVIKAAADCNRGNLWEIMDNAREEAIKAFKTDLMNYVGTLTKRKRNYFNGVVGEVEGIRPLRVNENFASLTWRCAIVRSGTMKMKRIGLHFDTAGTFWVYLYNNISDTPIAAWQVTANAGELTWFTLPSALTLPLTTDVAMNMQYWLMYDKTTAPNPRNDTITCGCSDFSRVNIWNSDLYRNLASPKALFNWLDWIVVAGSMGQQITKRRLNWTHDRYNYGLLVDMELTCNSTDIICKDNMDFVNDEISMVMAYTIRFKAAEKLIEKIIASGNISRYTMLDRERLWGKRNHYQKEAADRIVYLGDQLTRPERLNLFSDCLSCYDDRDFAKGNVRATDSRVPFTRFPNHELDAELYPQPNIEQQGGSY
jgi:hypothetical protein